MSGRTASSARRFWLVLSHLIVFGAGIFATGLYFSDAVIATLATEYEDPDAAEAILAAEDAYIEAELAGDEAALRRLIDDRFVLNSVGGQTSGKDTLIQAVLTMGMTAQYVSDRTVLVEGRVGNVFGTTTLVIGRPGPQQQALNYRYTSTYVNRDGEWRMLALHMQPMPAE